MQSTELSKCVWVLKDCDTYHSINWKDNKETRKLVQQAAVTFVDG